MNGYTFPNFDNTGVIIKNSRFLGGGWSDRGRILQVGSLGRTPEGGLQLSGWSVDCANVTVDRDYPGLLMGGWNADELEEISNADRVLRAAGLLYTPPPPTRRERFNREIKRIRRVLRSFKEPGW